MGQRVLKSCGSALGFLRMGLIAAVVKKGGNMPEEREEWLIVVTSGARAGGQVEGGRFGFPYEGGNFSSGGEGERGKGAGTGEGRKGCLGAGGSGVGQFTVDPGRFHGEEGQ